MSQQLPQRTAPDRGRGPRRLGAAMIIGAWVLVLGLLSLLFGDVLEQQHNPNQEVRSLTGSGGPNRVQLVQNRAGHYVANGHINDTQVVFLLDTGATDVSVPAGLARRLGLRSGAPQQARTANGVITTYHTTLDQVSLGDIVMRDVRAHINPGMDGNEVLLGMSFLRALDLTQRDGVLTLTQRRAG